MPQATPQELCAMLDAISVGATDQLQKLIGRFAALKRMADLLINAGINIPIPDTSQLINPLLVDIDKYNQLAALCPGILPPFSGTNLIELQQSLNNSYLKLLSQLDTHPFAKAGQLQPRVNGMIKDAAEEFQKRIGPGIQALNCARAICGASNSVGVYTPAVIQQAQTNYRNGIGAGGENANILSPEQQALVDKLAATRASLIGLLDTTTQQNIAGTAGDQSTFQTEDPSELSSQVLLRGSQGNQGIQGSDGAQGFQGAKGNIGSQGYQGYQGFQGTQGAPSIVPGPQGATGAQGIVGSPGSQGGIGAQGLTGAQGSLGGNYQPYQFSTSTTDADPGVGRLAFNNADPESITEIYVNLTNSNNVDVSEWLAAINSYGSAALKGVFHIYSISDPTAFLYVNVTLYSTATGYRKYSVNVVLAEGTFDDFDDIIIDFVPAGPSGPTGAQGFQGVTGAQGTQGHQGNQGNQGNQGFQGVQGSQGFQGFPGFSTSVWSYRANTSTAGNPAAGRIQWDNSTQISAASLYLNEISLDGFDSSNLLRSVEVGTRFAIQDTNNASDYQIWEISGSLSESVDVWTIPVTFISSGGAGTTNFANNTNVSILTARPGAQGSQGNQGFQGTAGSTGAQGNQGFQGTTGTQGSQGFQGFSKLTELVTHNFGTITSESAQDLAVPVGGASTGDCAFVNRTDGLSWPTGAVVSANVVSNGTVSLNVQNFLATDLIPGSMDMRVTVLPS